jgi:hypothetical protein
MKSDESVSCNEPDHCDFRSSKKLSCCAAFRYVANAEKDVPTSTVRIF